MDNEQITIYGMAFDSKGLKGFFSGPFCDFNGGFCLLEFFGENVLKPFSAPGDIKDRVDDLISARFFNPTMQLKCRRITDDIFWLAADFCVDGWTEQTKGTSSGVRHIALWGYANQELGNLLYEERIPYLFDYPSNAAAISLSHGDRFEVGVKEFRDQGGRVSWDRFMFIKKWEG